MRSEPLLDRIPRCPSRRICRYPARLLQKRSLGLLSRGEGCGEELRRCSEFGDLRGGGFPGPALAFNLVRFRWALLREASLEKGSRVVDELAGGPDRLG